MNAWNIVEGRESSTSREIKADYLGLSSFKRLLYIGHTKKWYTDNPSVVRIVEFGSLKLLLKAIAVDIFKFCISNLIIYSTKLLDSDWWRRVQF